MTKQKTEHEDTGQSMKTQHRDAANIPPLWKIQRKCKEGNFFKSKLLND